MTIKNLIQQLLAQLDDFAKFIPYFEVHDTTISQKNIAWHIDHCLLGMNVYLDDLKKSNPKNYHWKFNFFRLIVINTNLIPRGFGKAPENFIPSKDIDRLDLEELLIKTRHNIPNFEDVPKDRFAVHPVFGQLPLKRTLQVLKTHNHHHLKIIEDILKASNLK